MGYTADPLRTSTTSMPAAVRAVGEALAIASQVAVPVEPVACVRDALDDEVARKLDVKESIAFCRREWIDAAHRRIEPALDMSRQVLG